MDLVTPDHRITKEKERELIRRQLFHDGSANTKSMEVTTDGQIINSSDSYTVGSNSPPRYNSSSIGTEYSPKTAAIAEETLQTMNEISAMDEYPSVLTHSKTSTPPKPSKMTNTSSMPMALHPAPAPPVDEADDMIRSHVLASHRSGPTASLQQHGTLQQQQRRSERPFDESADLQRDEIADLEGKAINLSPNGMEVLDHSYMRISSNMEDAGSIPYPNDKDSHRLTAKGIEMTNDQRANSLDYTSATLNTTGLDTTLRSQSVGPSMEPLIRLRPTSVLMPPDLPVPPPPPRAVTPSTLDTGGAMGTATSYEESGAPAVMEDMQDLSTLGESLRSHVAPPPPVSPAESMSQPPTATTGATTTTATSMPRGTIVRQLFGAFQCADDSMGNNNPCTLYPQQAATNVMRYWTDQACNEDTEKERWRLRQREKREAQPSPEPFYDEAFTLRFIRRMTTKGAALLYLQAPHTTGNKSDDWKGRTVAMLIEKGSTGEAHASNVTEEPIQPRLAWTTVAGGQTFEVSTTSIGLLSILNVTTDSNQDSGSEEDKREGSEDSDLCFFTITTNEGDVYVFEANSPQERDSLVNGIKNVLARLAYHLIVGNEVGTAELYHDASNDDTIDNPTMSGSLPVVLNPRQTMDRVTHVLLD